MQIPILIEPIEGGRYRARAGEPFSASVEGETAAEATRQLETILRSRLQNGTQLLTINLRSGPAGAVPGPLHLDPLPDDDWFFRTMREAIADSRRRENAAGTTVAFPADELYKTDWVYRELREAIEENRRLEETEDP